MKKVNALLITIGLVSCCLVANASPATTESVNELVQLVVPQPELYVHAVTSSQKAKYADTLSKMLYGEPSVDQFNEIYSATSREIDQAVNWQTIKPEIIEAFSNHFTEEEIKGLVAFFSSPAGAAWLKNGPRAFHDIEEKINRKMMDRLNTPSLEMQNLIGKPQSRNASPNREKR